MNRGLSKKCRKDFFNTLGRAFVPARLSSAASVRNGLCPVPGSPAHPKNGEGQSLPSTPYLPDIVSTLEKR